MDLVLYGLCFWAAGVVSKRYGRQSWVIVLCSICVAVGSLGILAWVLTNLP